MQLLHILESYKSDYLKKYVKLLGGPSSLTRKADRLAYVHQHLTTPNLLGELWSKMDEVSQKAVAAAYHNEGLLNRSAFTAQYGQLPFRAGSRYGYTSKLLLLDLFLHENQLPTELMALLAELVPAPERFQLEGMTEVPENMHKFDYPVMRADTALVGFNDLLTYLRLVEQKEIKFSATNRQPTAASLRKIAKHLMAGDFFELPDKPKSKEVIRPFGLDIFTKGAGFVTRTGSITKAGREFLQRRESNLLLLGFEKWAEKSQFDELDRIPGIKGKKGRKTRLTAVAPRRAQVIEALSWCPVNVWIDIEEFYRAIKIWDFDFDVEKTNHSNLSTGYGSYYDTSWHSNSYWRIVKGLYINAVLWEILATIGALDLLYIPSEEMRLISDGEAFSLYDGLLYFRINNLGAYLLGQANEYVPAQLAEEKLFSVASDMTITLSKQNGLTPNEQLQLELIAEAVNELEYRLSTQRLLKTLEEGQDWQQFADFLAQGNNGALPAEVSDWLKQLYKNSQAFKRGKEALFIELKRKNLIELLLQDAVLSKLCHKIDDRTVVIAASSETRFRKRLKELEYVLVG